MSASPPVTQDGAQPESIERFLEPLFLDDDKLHALAYRWSKVYRQLALTSREQFLPTPVTQLPTGQEAGRYLAIDVGGTNLRVAFIELLGESADSDSSAEGTDRSRETLQKAQRQRVRRTLEKAWPIGEHLKKDQANELFSWIGDCIAEVVADSLSSEATPVDIPAELEMGITFSFPMMQESLADATLMPMGKGFAITSDLNLRQILLAGYERHTRRPADDYPSAKRRKLYALPKLKIAAITNDTVATLASLAYSVKSLPNSRVAMGIIVGTGCNATIPMKLADLHEDKAAHVSARSPNATETVVNTEWTISGADPPLKELNVTTKWDFELDQNCARPGFQPFEYMTGGRYIGELVRIITYDYLTTVVGLQKRQLPANLVQDYALTTSFVSSVIARARSDAILVNDLNRQMPAPESSDWSWTPSSVNVIRAIARAVQSRSAGLIAAATIGLLAATREIQLAKPSKGGSPPLSESREDALSPAPDWNSGPEELVVAYTGGIIQHYPNFKETCQRYIDKLVMRGGPQDGGKSVFLREASDGGIIGAGVLAGTVAGRV